MLKLRFNIANLVVIIFILGVAFAALRESSDLWESGLFTLTLGVLLISILFAVHRTEPKRAIWLGFAIFGGIYLALSLVPSIESRLTTTKVLAYLDSKVSGRPTGSWIAEISGNGSTIRFGKQLATSRQGPVRLWDAATGKLLSGWSGTTENFVRIGHSLFALLAGWLGGQLSRRLCQSSRHPEVSMSVETGGSPR